MLLHYDLSQIAAIVHRVIGMKMLQPPNVAQMDAYKKVIVKVERQTQMEIAKVRFTYYMNH